MPIADLGYMNVNRKIRAFLAIEVSRGLAPISLFERVDSEHQLRPVKTGNLHLTLEFFGDIEPVYVHKIEIAMQSVSFREFSLEFSGLGAFPGPDRGRVLFIRVEDQPELDRIRNLILQKLGRETGNSFVPHVTIGRAKQPFNLNPLIDEFRDISFESKVNQVTLFASELTANGPVYRELEKITSISE
jgi:2'-5' RNA ligase